MKITLRLLQFLLLAFCIPLLAQAEKPKITKHKDKWWRSEFDIVEKCSVEVYNSMTGKIDLVSVSIDCRSTGSQNCSTIMSGIPADYGNLTAPERNLVESLNIYAQNAANSGTTSGNHSENIVVTDENNVAHTYCYTVTWGVNSDDSLDMEIESTEL